MTNKKRRAKDTLQYNPTKQLNNSENVSEAITPVPQIEQQQQQSSELDGDEDKIVFDKNDFVR